MTAKRLQTTVWRVVLKTVKKFFKAYR